MASKEFVTGREIERIRGTLELRDPDRRTILVGSGAVLAHFYELGLEAPVSCDDVDTLCSQEFFDSILANPTSLSHVSKLQLRWPKGRLALRGATNLSIDLYPPEGSSILPFTAAVDMSDAFFPTKYEDLKHTTVESSGIMCVPLPYILTWIATIGREKDITAVKTILPPAQEAGLINDNETNDVLKALEISIKDRALHPERYYARVDIA